MGFRILLVGLGLAWAAACSHKSFQYRAEGAQAERLEEATASFAAATREEDPEQVPLDLLGRQALLDLLRHAVQEGALEAPDRDLLIGAALVAGGPGTAGRPFTEQELASSAFELARRLATEAGLSTAQARALTQLLGAPGEPERSQRVGQIRRMIASLELQACEPIEPSVSYRGSILRHVEIPGSEPFERWRDTVESLHLVSVECGQKRGLLLMSEVEETSRPQIVAWQFFDPDVWPVVEERLRESLDLPPDPTER